MRGPMIKMYVLAISMALLLMGCATNPTSTWVPIGKRYVMTSSGPEVQSCYQKRPVGRKIRCYSVD